MPQIGIVVPLYNGERYLAATLESVLAQAFIEWELVVVDDGSNDRSGAIADAFASRDPRVSVLHTPNGGLSAARNLGLRSLDTGCEFIIFLDADDTWYPYSLGVLYQALLEDRQAAGVHGAYRFIDKVGHDLPQTRIERIYRRRWRFVGRWLVNWPVARPTTFAALALMNPIATPGQVLLRRSALSKVGEFDPTIPAVADWDMWIRLTAGGYLTYVDRVVLSYRRHVGSMSSHRAMMHQATEALFRKHAASGELTPQQRCMLEQRWLWELWLTMHVRLIWALEHREQRRYLQAAKETLRAARALVRFYLGCIRFRCSSLTVLDEE